MIKEKWHNYNLSQQFGNIGSEILRAINREKVGDMAGRQKALERSLELIDFTISDSGNSRRLKEIVRLRELVAGNYLNNDYYQVSLEDLNKYLLAFGLLAKN